MVLSRACMPAEGVRGMNRHCPGLRGQMHQAATTTPPTGGLRGSKTVNCNQGVGMRPTLKPDFLRFSSVTHNTCLLPCSPGLNSRLHHAVPQVHLLLLLAGLRHIASLLLLQLLGHAHMHLCQTLQPQLLQGKGRCGEHVCAPEGRSVRLFAQRPSQSSCRAGTQVEGLNSQRLFSGCAMTPMHLRQAQCQLLRGRGWPGSAAEAIAFGAGAVCLPFQKLCRVHANVCGGLQLQLLRGQGFVNDMSGEPGGEAS